MKKFVDQGFFSVFDYTRGEGWGWLINGCLVLSGWSFFDGLVASIRTNYPIPTPAPLPRTLNSMTCAPVHITWLVKRGAVV